MFSLVINSKRRGAFGLPGPLLISTQIKFYFVAGFKPPYDHLHISFLAISRSPFVSLD